MSKVSTQQHTESLETLRELLPEGTVVWGIVRSVAKSGMSRTISFHIVQGTEIRDITWHVSNALGYKLTGTRGVRVNGAGMDMIFHVVYGLGAAIHGSGYALTSAQI